MIGFTFLIQGLFPSSDTKVYLFFEKTNKTTTKYQNLELSDP